MKKIPGFFLILFFSLFLSNIILFYRVYDLYGKWEYEKNRNAQNISSKDYLDWISSLPESKFKTNMMVVFLAEYRKDTNLLFDVLQSYVEVESEQ